MRKPCENHATRQRRLSWTTDLLLQLASHNFGEVLRGSAALAQAHASPSSPRALLLPQLVGYGQARCRQPPRRRGEVLRVELADKRLCYTSYGSPMGPAFRRSGFPAFRLSGFPAFRLSASLADFLAFRLSGVLA